MFSIRKAIIIAIVSLLATGCATVGCELDPLHPKKALRCEMPLR
jgi:hypothetical protein